MKILNIFEIHYKARKIIKQLCKNQTTSIKIKLKKREAAIRKGMKKGCKLSPLQFNKYIEKAINECKDITLELK